MSSDMSADVDADFEPDMTPPTPPPWDPPLSEVDGRFRVRVLLDYEPISEAWLAQGGSANRAQTDESGEAWFEIESAAVEPLMVFASHPEARTRGAEVSADRREGLTINLTRFATPDNTAYPFSDPGEPDRRPTTSQCGHCHLDINDAWFESPHRSSARNPIVYDLYTGRGSGWTDELSCTEAGGRWALAQAPGQAAAPGDRVAVDGQEWGCYFEISALSAFNERCEQTPCASRELGDEAYFGGCADCHAPAKQGIEGGGHDLLLTRGIAFEYGVSCDLCHHVESVRPEESAGVGGRLKLMRPRESASVTLGGGGYLPLSFGPNRDVANPRMGLSPRAHFRDGSLCGGCHQHDHDDVHAREPIDRARWPEGRLPNQSTYAEWLASDLGSVDLEEAERSPESSSGKSLESSSKRVPCNSCHMPPNPRVMNSANLESFAFADTGLQGGWPRPLGETREHTWWGPRQPQSSILNLSADVTLTSPQRVTLESEGGDAGEREGGQVVEVTASVTNLGAGHGLPTGEPMRHLILVVEARCGDRSLDVVGGDAVHEIGGSIERRARARADEPWRAARVGDTLRVVRVSADAYDYDGYGPFRDVTRDEARGIIDERVFEPSEKGLLREAVIGEARVTAVSVNGELTLDQPLPGEGSDVVYLTRDEHPRGYAGMSGFTFARVLEDVNQRTMTPHFIAVDLTRDNRLRPGATWRSQHVFRVADVCDDLDDHREGEVNGSHGVEVSARLIYRPYPRWLALERGWTMWDRVVRVAHARELNASSLDSVSTLSPPLGEALTKLEVTRALLDARAEGLSERLCDLSSSSSSSSASSSSSSSSAPCVASLYLSSAWSELSPTQDPSAPPALPLLLTSITRADTERASRRGEGWPWRTALISASGEVTERTEVAESSDETNEETDEGTNRETSEPLSLSGVSALMNLSAHPLAIEPIEGVDVVGIARDLTPHSERVNRVEISRATELWVIPPGGGALLIPRVTLESAPILAAGYSEHGGRSWTPSTVIGELSASADDVALVHQITDQITLRPAPVLSSSARESTALEGVTRAHAWSYRGSPRADRWSILGAPLLVSSSDAGGGGSRLLSVRNLSATGQPFSIDQHPHWRWVENQGWSAARAVSWIPIHGEVLIALPALEPGRYEAGGGAEGLRGVIEVE